MFCSLISSTISSLCFPVRLANGGYDTNSGRVEIYHNGQWGTVCAQYFTQEETNVVCKMLGHAFGLRVRADHYGRGRGPIWLDNVNCQGHESDLADCEHLPWGEHTCTHYMDVGVQCYWVAMERKWSHFDENVIMAALKIARIWWLQFCIESWHQMEAYLIIGISIAFPVLKWLMCRL